MNLDPKNLSVIFFLSKKLKIKFKQLTQEKKEEF